MALERQVRIVERVLTRLKLKQLRLLVAVGERRSILHASRDLNMSQPAATKLIRDLEIDFDVQLFERSNRGMVPTPYGDVLIRHGKQILAQVSHAAQELDDLKGGAGGRIVVGTLLAASAELLPRTIAAVTEARPQLVIKTVEGTNEVLMPALRAGEVDLVLGRLPTHRHRDEILQERLYDEEVICVARTGHPLTAQRSLKLIDLMDYGWVLPPPETTLRRQLDQVFLEAGLEGPQNALESVSYLANRGLLTRTDLIGVMPRHVALPDIANGLLTDLKWPVPIPIGPVGVSIRRNATLSPAAEFFLRQLREVGADIRSGQSSGPGPS